MSIRRCTLVILGTLLAGVGSVDAAPSRVTFWSHGGTEAETASALAEVKRFNASQTQYEVVVTKIRTDFFAPGSTFSYSSAVYAAALAGELPDVLDLDSPNLSNYAWRGLVAPLDGVVSAITKADLLPSLVQEGSYDGKLYAVGQYESGLALAGRRSLLIKAGVRIPTGVKDAWTFEEFKGALAKLKASKAAPYALDLKMNYGANEWYSYAFSPIFQGFGGDLIDRSTYRKAAGTLNGRDSVAAARFLKSLFDDKYARANSTDEDFVNGTAALGFCGHWMALSYLAAFKDDFVLIPMPQWGTRAVTGRGSWQRAISTQAKNPSGAAAFLQFTLSPGEIQITSKEYAAIPGRKSVLAQDDQFRPGGRLEVFAQQLQNGVAIPRPLTPAYPVVTIAFYAALYSILYEGVDAQEALDIACERIDSNIVNNDYYQPVVENSQR